VYEAFQKLEGLKASGGGLSVNQRLHDVLPDVSSHGSVTQQPRSR
jgi:hypothetical protein